jgi:glycyl-tRNA synthetase
LSTLEQKIRKNESSFGIAQTGKAFRNEIAADNLFLVCANLNKWKCNFVRGSREMKHYEFWKEPFKMALIRLGKENYRFHDHEN